MLLKLYGNLVVFRCVQNLISNKLSNSLVSVEISGIYFVYNGITNIIFTINLLGCRSSPIFFDHLSRAICWIATNVFKVKFIFHILDDFSTIDRPDSCAERTMALMTTLFKRLNIPLAKHEVVSRSLCSYWIFGNYSWYGKNGSTFATGESNTHL